MGKPSGLPSLIVADGSPRQSLNAVRLALAVRSSSADIAHLVGTNALVFAPFCRALRGETRIVRQIFTSYDHKDRVIRPARLLISSMFIQAYVFTMPWMGMWADEKAPRTRNFVLRPPINCDFYRPISPRMSVVPDSSHDFRILYMGPLLASRFPPLSVLGGLSRLVKRGVDAQLVVLTSPARTSSQQAARLVELANRLGLENHVVVTRVDLSEEERIDAYNSSDIVVFPFVGPEPEKLADPPFGMLEAMACGRLVLATRVLSIPEVIQDGVNGFLAVRATPDDIGSGFERALRSPHRGDIQKSARQKILDIFSYDKIREDAVRVYSSIL